MKHTLSFFKRSLFVIMLLAFAGITSGQLVSAETPDNSDVVSIAGDITDPHEHDDHDDHDDCVIPESGPWPPCATGGTPPSSSDGDCVIPESGPWPPCATGGSGGSAPPTSSGDDCVIPESGPWPPCATGSGGGSAPTPPATAGEPCPSSGPWPAGCVPQGGSDSPDSSPPPPAVSEADLRARIEVGLDQLEDYWKAELKDLGVNYRPPGIVQIYEGEEGAPPNAFYVPSADAVFIDLRLLNELAVEYGEYSAVAVLAHEWGHFIQDQLDLLSTSRPLRGIELQADCFTGSFTQYLSNTGQLQAGEKDAASDLFYSIGDDIINPDAPYNQPGAHGTGDERRGAFEYGWANSDNACLSAYNN